MSTEFFITIAGVTISLISVFVAFWSARKSNSFSKEQTELQRRVVELEEQRERERQLREDRADLRAVFQYYDSVEGYDKKASFVNIVNNGKMEARNIRMFINGDPHIHHKFIRAHNLITFNPIKPGGPCGWALNVTEETPQSCDIELKWDDDTGKNHTWKEKVPLKI